MPKALSLTQKEEERLFRINVVKRKNFLFQKIDLVLGWEVPYIAVYNSSVPAITEENLCARLSLLNAEIIHCRSNKDTEWGMGYYEMDQFIKFLKGNLREEYHSLPELSLWDYICYLYSKETNDTLLEMPNYQLLYPHPEEEIDGVKERGYNLSKELLEDRNIYDLYTMISKNMYIFLPISRYNDLTTDRTHFILGDVVSLEHCTKAARISFIEPKYLHCSDVNTEEWVLSKEEINTMIDYFSKDNYERWDEILEWRDGLVKRCSIQLTPLIGIPMPDYTKLI